MGKEKCADLAHYEKQNVLVNPARCEENNVLVNPAHLEKKNVLENPAHCEKKNGESKSALLNRYEWESDPWTGLTLLLPEESRLRIPDYK